MKIENLEEFGSKASGICYVYGESLEELDLLTDEQKIKAFDKLMAIYYKITKGERR